MMEKTSCSILEKRKDLLIVRNKAGMIETVPTTQYYLIKYESYEGNRIIYKLDDDRTITETYNDGIFNCTFKKHLIQIRKREDIALSIAEHAKNKSTSMYDNIFSEEYTKIHRDEILDSFFTHQQDRVMRHGDIVKIDDTFYVDSHGTAHVWNEQSNRWSILCIVVSKTTENLTIVTDSGDIKIDETMQSVLAKVQFLLHPNMTDDVFTNQLPKDILERLRKQHHSTQQN